MSMNVNFEKIAEEAFENELEKISDDVKIPEGGLKPGLLYQDITQVMSPKDAERVKRKKNLFLRSGPGLLPMGILGATTGSNIPNLYNDIKSLIKYKKLSKKPFKLSGKGALIGAGLGLGLPYILTRSGAYNKQTLKAAKKLIEETKENE